MNEFYKLNIRDNWETPKELFEKYDKIYNFKLDPCADNKNHLCDFYYTKEDDGLMQKWYGPVFVNPPYGKVIYKWVCKSYLEYKRGNIVVLLLPARTDTKWFHEYILPYADIHFIKGRLRFGNSKQNAPFPSMICILDPN